MGPQLGAGVSDQACSKQEEAGTVEAFPASSSQLPPWGAGLEFHLLTNPLLASATVCHRGGTKGHQAEHPAERQSAASICVMKGEPLPGLLTHAQEALMQRDIC